MAEPPATVQDAEAAVPGWRRWVPHWRTWSRRRLALIAALLALLVLGLGVGAWWWSTLPSTRGASQRGLPKSAASARSASAAASSPVAGAASAAEATAVAPAVPDIRPRLPEAAIGGASTHFALVSPAIPSRAEAETMQRRLQAEAARIRHPTATETSIVQTPEGWRVSWWPFDVRRQAENARSAMAAQRISLEVVDF